jgi:hypothetical protein
VKKAPVFIVVMSVMVLLLTLLEACASTKLTPPASSVPPLKITVVGHIPGGNQRAVDSFLQTYPYLVKYLGEPFSIGTEGITWDYNANSQIWGGFDALTNTVHLGANMMPEMKSDLDPPYAWLDESFQHETVHLFYDVGNTAINFTFGQWVREAHVLAGQFLANQDALGLPSSSFGFAAYDAQAYLGYEVVNGVMRDYEKWNRSIVDGNATQALLLLTEVLSADSDRDFLKRVNADILAYYRTTGSPEISAATYSDILDRAAGGRKIDGQSPGEWLFSQPVANIAGATGDYLAIVPLYAYPTRFWVFSFRREKQGQDYRETVLEDLDVTLTVYNARGEVVGQTKLQSAGGMGTELDGREFLAPDLPDGGYLVKAQASIDGKSLTCYNYFVIMQQAQNIHAEKDSMTVVMMNTEGNALVPSMPEGMTITGGEISKTLPGVIVLTAAPGTGVEFKLNGFRSVVSKPVTGRVVALRLP